MRGQVWPANRIDPALNAMEAPSRYPVFDRPGAQAELEELSSSDHSVLFCSNLPHALLA
jgi:hypothetical protein